MTVALQYFASLAAVLTALIGALVLAGWALNIGLLKTVLPGQASMKPLTALGLLLAAAALWMLRNATAAAGSRRARTLSLLAHICSALVATLGALILLEYLLGVDWGIDQALFPQAVLAENALPIGRPAPVTAFCLLLLGLALFMLDAKPAWISPSAALVALLLGALAVMGYAYEVTTLYQIGPFVPIALHTALAIVLVSLGLLAARPKGPFLGVLTTPLAGSVIGRWLLPAVLVVPFLLGLVRLYGQHLGLYDTGFGVALLVTGNVVVFAVLVYGSARQLNQMDIRREAAHTGLREREQRLQALADATPNGLITVSPAGSIEWANRQAEALFGYAPGQLVGRRVDELVPRRFHDRHPAYRHSYLSEGQARAMGADSDMFGQRLDGSEFPVEIGLSPLDTSQGSLTLASIVDITQRKSAETDLRLSEERFAKAFRASPAALTVTRLVDGRFIDVNARFLELLGYERDEVIGQTSAGLNMFPDPADRAGLVRRLREDGTVRNFQIDLLTKDGARRTVLFSTEEMNVAGEAHILATLIDISDRKRAEAALLELNAELEARVAQRTADLAGSEVKFRTMFNVLPVGVSILDDRRRVVDSNPALARILQMSSATLADNPYADRKFIRPDGTPLPPEEFPSARVLQDQQPVFHIEIGVVADGGDTIWIDVSGAPLPVPGFSAVIVTADLTERKRIESDLRQSEERFAKAFRSSPTALTITRSSDNIFVDVNDAFETIFGFRRDEIVGHAATDLNIITNPEERAEMLRQFRERGSVHNFEMLRRTKSGELRHVLMSADTLELDGQPHILTTMLDITARKQAEADLRASEAKLRALFEVLPLGVSILDNERHIVESNPALARILRLSDDGLAAGAYSTRQIIRSDGSLMPLAEYASVRAFEEQRPVAGVETGMILETGQTIWLDISAAPLKSVGLGVVAVSVDITRRKQAEAALRESEAKFSKSFHASGAGIVISRTLDGRILEANDSYLRLVGYEREEVIGRTTLEIKAITPAVRDQLVAAIREHGHVRDMEIGVLTKTGQARTVVTSTETILIGAEQCLLSILYDITERKQIEQALAQERDQLQALMDNIPDTIYFKDRASRFTRVNLAQARMLGLVAPDLAIGKTDSDFQSTPLAADFYAEEQRLLDSGEPLVDRLEFNPTPAGEPRWLSATKVPLKDGSGQVVGLVGISRDITGRIRAEEDLQRLNRRLAGQVSELSLLNKFDEQLQSCLTIDETHPLITQIMSQLAPGLVGALYSVDAGWTQAVIAGRWGAPAPAPQVMGLDDCWALRLGQLHLVDTLHAGLPCRHFQELSPPASLCQPLLVQGQVLGVLQLYAATETGAPALDQSTQQLVQVVADSVALTWANLNLRASLRQQAIRDPLTGLFNRRFMEESLARELNRAARNHQSVGMIMMDLDHFKQINDRFGHETGDAVLRAIGRLLEASSRGSDIPCRYGGEEFLLILPEASLEIAAQRAEQIRAAFAQLHFGAEGSELGRITLSLGVAAYPQHGEVLEATLRAADAALYRAKSEGRDRTVVAPD